MSLSALTYLMYYSALENSIIMGEFFLKGWSDKGVYRRRLLGVVYIFTGQTYQNAYMHHKFGNV